MVLAVDEVPLIEPTGRRLSKEHIEVQGCLSLR